MTYQVILGGQFPFHVLQSVHGHPLLPHELILLSLEERGFLSRQVLLLLQFPQTRVVLLNLSLQPLQLIYKIIKTIINKTIIYSHPPQPVSPTSPPYQLPNNQILTHTLEEFEILARIHIWHNQFLSFLHLQIVNNENCMVETEFKFAEIIFLQMHAIYSG